MVTFRGDAWKFYLKLKETKKKGKNINELKELTELEEMKHFYEGFTDDTLRKIRYRMLKELKGSGIIPIFVTTIPWLLFIFSKQLQAFLFRDGSHLWLAFALVYVTLLFFSVIIHFREQAWANVNTEMIEDILEKRKENTTAKK